MEESQKLLNQTSAALAMMQSQPLDLSKIEDISGILNSAVSGQLLSLSEICAVRRTLKAARDVWEKLMEMTTLDGDSLERYYSFCCFWIISVKFIALTERYRLLDDLICVCDL